jgi:hypothetical protein
MNCIQGLDLSFLSLTLCASERNVASNFFSRVHFRGRYRVLIFRWKEGRQGLDLSHLGSSLYSRETLNEACD